MNKIIRLYKLFYEKRFRFVLWGSKVTVEEGGVFEIGKNVTIKNSQIYVKKGARLIIGDNTSLSKVSISMIVGEKCELYIGKDCKIEAFDLSLTAGRIQIGDYNMLQKGDSAVKPHFEVEGTLTIGHYNRLRCSIWLRFNGQVAIGSRNAINEGTEIRCDEKVTIGDYNQISYDCIFWDTNTHNLYKAQKRREITDKQYPDFGLEFEKPKTLPIAIGSDCWIGKAVTMLKGTKVEDKCIVGYGTLLSNISISENKTIMNQPNLRIIDNQL
ncbi:hypothetical protein [Confluentibacter sediminis]|uniref:hypothetical protein n=1 Tax=Confluentibacter sediminis TaxID=2219045 RepID=UPI000DAD5A8F|nr:hypothetical protein [Confluentibacter sediminis]